MSDSNRESKELMYVRSMLDAWIDDEDVSIDSDDTHKLGGFIHDLYRTIESAGGFDSDSFLSMIDTSDRGDFDDYSGYQMDLDLLDL